MENKVAKKAIITIDLLKLIPLHNLVGLDIKPFLYKDLIVKEDVFKEALKTFEFNQYKNKLVYLHCSNKAIIPMWAYMRLAHSLAKNKITHTYANTYDDAVSYYINHAINTLDTTPYIDKRIVIKGCGSKLNLSPSCYTHITEKLSGVARAISYGEACSMVSVSKN